MNTEAQEMHKASIVLRAGFSVLMVATMVIFYIAYLLFWPVTVLEVKRAEVTPKVVGAGDTITLLLSYCKHQDLDAHVQVSFEGEVLLFSLSGLPKLPPGCHTKYPLPVIVPASTPDGTWHLRAEHEYDVNSIRKVSLTYRSQDFKVRKNPVLHPEPAY